MAEVGVKGLIDTTSENVRRTRVWRELQFQYRARHSLACGRAINQSINQFLGWPK